MTTVNFPASPILNQQYTYGTRTWFWDGSGWERFLPTGAVGTAFTELDGPFMTAYVLALEVDFKGAFTLLTHI